MVISRRRKCRADYSVSFSGWSRQYKACDNTLKICLRSPAAAASPVNEWHISYHSFHSPGLIRNVWCCRAGLCEILGYTFGKPQSSLRQQKHEEFIREGEVPSEFLACKLAGLFTFIFNIR